VDAALTPTGHFSILRWRNDATRDEARNVAVILVAGDGSQGAVRAAPVSAISPRLHEQGILDKLILHLDEQFRSHEGSGLSRLHELHRSLQHSIYLTEPKPTAMPDMDLVLSALYRAYVTPRPARGARALTKGRVLDSVISRIRSEGFTVHRGDYVSDYLFDAVLEGRDRTVLDVLSFATSAQNWVPVEHDAGYFLYAMERVHSKGLAVIQEPTDSSHSNAVRAYKRVVRWFDEARVPTVAPDKVTEALTAPD
jgi:hypothetical protein